MGKKYLQHVDLVITSNERFKKNLVNKYPFLKSKIINWYFGYIEKNQFIRKKSKNNLKTIIYGGNIKVIFIGDINNYKPLFKYKGIKNIEFLQRMEHSQYMKFLVENADIGFLSLKREYFGACTPSKIFEYLNLNLPILAALPEGDAKEIINHNQYGIATDYDKKLLKEAVEKLLLPENLENISNKILTERDQWSFENQFKYVKNTLSKMCIV